MMVCAVFWVFFVEVPWDSHSGGRRLVLTHVYIILLVIYIKKKKSTRGSRRDTSQAPFMYLCRVVGGRKEVQ